MAKVEKCCTGNNVTSINFGDFGKHSTPFLDACKEEGILKPSRFYVMGREDVQDAPSNIPFILSS